MAAALPAAAQGSGIVRRAGFGAMATSTCSPCIAPQLAQQRQRRRDAAERPRQSGQKAIWADAVASCSAWGCGRASGVTAAQTRGAPCRTAPDFCGSGAAAQRRSVFARAISLESPARGHRAAASTAMLPPQPFTPQHVTASPQPSPFVSSMPVSHQQQHQQHQQHTHHASPPLPSQPLWASLPNGLLWLLAAAVSVFIAAQRAAAGADAALRGLLGGNPSGQVGQSSYASAAASQLMPPPPLGCPASAARLLARLRQSLHMDAAAEALRRGAGDAANGHLLSALSHNCVCRTPAPPRGASTTADFTALYAHHIRAWGGVGGDDELPSFTTLVQLQEMMALCEEDAARIELEALNDTAFSI
uniref:Uncharacterized protein n=1 Tax=Chlamydomonas euryale TaxID=1486919 RepID=A0A7R9V5R7_9CHLO|mmetsp:Transcript_20709/g.61829  ORF Transcript_20709/g.61829 Transcript_20709/m.61829 type:complete len:361 (+) Transcript_20709:230-1312(+)